MRHPSPLLILKLIAVVALLAAVAVPAASAAPAKDALSLHDARAQIRVATENWAGLMDGRAHVGRCERPGAHLVRCGVVIKSQQTRCDMRVTVKRTKSYDVLRARGVHCAQAGPASRR